MKREITFKIKFKPKSDWVDEIYIGNMLIELLTVLAKSSSAFEFDIELEK